MAIGIYPDQWEAWEVDPSTRQNTHVWTKSVPVDVTLAVAGTAENLYAVSPDVQAVNLVTNPSFETGSPPTGYTAAGAALARVTTVVRSSTYSLRITPNNAAAGEGAYWTLPSLAAHEQKHFYLVASAYFQDNAGSGNGARVVIADSSGATLANGTAVALSATWQRSVAFYPLSAAGQVFRAYLVTSAQHGTVFFVDDLLAEIQAQAAATAYVDGSLGVGYAWDSAAHASMSRRRRGLAILRGYTLHTTRDIYIAEDVTASSTTGRYVRAGTDFWEEFPLNVQRNLSIINVNAGETPRVYGVVRGVHFGQQA